MRRYEAIQEIMRTVSDELVVCNIGHPCQELFALADRPGNFYMLGSLGLASSIGLGLATAQEKFVVVLDGDGGLLMNLGSLATIGALQPENLLLVVIDNEAYGSTGDQPTFTGAGVALDRVAAACGIERVIRLEAQTEIGPRIAELLRERRGPYFVLIKTAAGLPDGIAVIPLSAAEIKDRFMKEVRA